MIYKTATSKPALDAYHFVDRKYTDPMSQKTIASI